jgi:hypothetical protein
LVVNLPKFTFIKIMVKGSDGRKKLDENRVIELLTGHLGKTGYNIIQSREGDQKGVDIVADNIKAKQQLFVEVKGETNSRGKAFDKKQVKNHIAKAVLAAMRMLSVKQQGSARVKVALAFPLNEGHQKELETIKPAIKKLGIRVYLVSEKKIVEE